MKYEHRAIIDAAAREGKLPSELAKELLGHDLLKAMVTAISKPAVPFSKMSEQQQEGVIEDLRKELLPAISTAISTIVSQGSHSVRMKLKKLETGTSFKLTGSIEKTQDHIHALMDLATDNSDVLVILHERDYVQGLDAVKGEKDQKPLDLDSDAPIKPEKKPRAASGAKAAGGIAKAIELPPKLVEDARAFIIDQQNCKASALQNFLKCNFGKAEALQKLFEKEGLIEFVGTDASGDYELVRKVSHVPRTIVHKDGQVITTEDGSDPFEGLDDAEDWTETLAGAGESPKEDLPTEITELTDDLYDRIVAKTTEKGQATAGALSVTFDISFEIAEQAFDRMELEGVIDADGNLAESETFPVMD